VHGAAFRLQVYRIDRPVRWSVRTLEAIPKGAFVVEYVGEVMPAAVSDARMRSPSHDFRDSKTGVSLYKPCVFRFALSDSALDPLRTGNVARFLRSSCTPNVEPRMLFADHQNLQFPRLGLWAMRDIGAGEEITFGHDVNCCAFTCFDPSAVMWDVPMHA